MYCMCKIEKIKLHKQYRTEHLEKQSTVQYRASEEKTVQFRSFEENTVEYRASA